MSKSRKAMEIALVDAVGALNVTRQCDFGFEWNPQHFVVRTASHRDHHVLKNVVRVVFERPAHPRETIEALEDQLPVDRYHIAFSWRKPDDLVELELVGFSVPICELLHSEIAICLSPMRTDVHQVVREMAAIVCQLFDCGLLPDKACHGVVVGVQ